jgi:hypothetical protein
MAKMKIMINHSKERCNDLSLKIGYAIFSHDHLVNKPEQKIITALKV